ncbi:hypothetical protein L484_027462 [Morus notabilis]|uniref:Uncharacterized protein n=1 Tax=Morus notabilis TaxID=981085 RepID=W9S649_9ROSA|nr:hypothetical protein L484_027462 [Morus notabilis]
MNRHSNPSRSIIRKHIQRRGHKAWIPRLGRKRETERILIQRPKFIQCHHDIGSELGFRTRGRQNEAPGQGPSLARGNPQESLDLGGICCTRKYALDMSANKGTPRGPTVVTWTWASTVWAADPINPRRLQGSSEKKI